MSGESNRRKYDREFKLEAVRLSREAGRTVTGMEEIVSLPGEL